VFISQHFKRQIKRLLKKDPDLKDILLKSLNSFTKKNAIYTSSGVYKIRLPRPGKGKSGGYRVYVFLFQSGNHITPICIYPKNETESITTDVALGHLNKVLFEIKMMVDE